MIFKDNKKYYRERKVSTSTKKKLEIDTLKKNMRNFSFEDIAKQTKISRKVQKDKPIKDKSLIPTYNTTTIKENSLSAYGTYLKEDKKKKELIKPTRSRVIFKHNANRSKRKLIKDKSKYASTIEDYITRQQLMKRKKTKQNKQPLSKLQKTSQNISTITVRDKHWNLKGKERVKESQKRNRSVNNSNNEDTIDILLKRIPTEK